MEQVLLTQRISIIKINKADMSSTRGKECAHKHKNRTNLIMRSFLQPRVNNCDIRKKGNRLTADEF